MSCELIVIAASPVVGAFLDGEVRTKPLLHVAPIPVTPRLRVVGADFEYEEGISPMVKPEHTKLFKQSVD